MTLIVAPTDGFPPVLSAGSDAFPFGDNPISRGVMGNDSNGHLAVLNGHPPIGRLQSFTYGGNFELAPPLIPQNATFSYSLFNEYGHMVEANVLLYSLQMDIYNGQGGEVVKPELRTSKGAFTVANLNDTNGDGTADVSQNEVTVAAGDQTGRASEVDLMKLVIAKPDDPNPEGNQVSITVSAGAALWTQSFKGSAGPATIPVSDLPKTLWVEATQGSAALADITITMTYRNESTKVNATGIWTQMTQFKNTGSGVNAPPADMESNDMWNMYNAWGQKVGAAHTSPPKNFMIMEFTVSPPGVGKVKGVVFDLSRTKATKHWQTDNAGNRNLVGNTPFPDPTLFDKCNDDEKRSDEQYYPKSVSKKPGFIVA